MRFLLPVVAIRIPVRSTPKGCAMYAVEPHQDTLAHEHVVVVFLRDAFISSSIGFPNTSTSIHFLVLRLSWLQVVLA